MNKKIMNQAWPCSPVKKSIRSCYSVTIVTKYWVRRTSKKKMFSLITLDKSLISILCVSVIISFPFHKFAKCSLREAQCLGYIVKEKTLPRVKKSFSFFYCFSLK